ncbi:hypothetical protein [Lacinutrix chionoecetis]
MRQRIVNGVITTITENDHLSRAIEGNINYSSNSTIEEIGTDSGVSYADYETPPASINTVEIEGPFDENWEPVDFLARDEFYYYRVSTDVEATEEDVAKLKWVIKYNDQDTYKLVYTGGTLLSSGKIGMKLSINQSRSSDNFDFYAYFYERSEDVKLNVLIEDGEILMVVGTEQHSATIGNKLMFPAQAVREIKENYSHHKYTNIVIFKDGYTAMQLSIIKRDARRWNNEVYFKEITTTQELINYINNGDATVSRSNKKLGIIKIYSHGLPSILDFGLDGPNELAQRFLVSDISELNVSAFATYPFIHSFACRTGNVDSRLRASSPGYQYGSDWETHVRPQDSFAQKLSDHLDGKVYSYLRRSNYSPTWDDGGDQDYTEDYVHIESEDVSNPLNPMDWLRNRHRWDEALWNLNGGYAPPRAGSSPGGELPSDLYQFQKGKAPIKKE